MRWLTFGALALAGCFSPDFQSGKFQCAVSGECPPTFHCASDDKCYAAGDNPRTDDAAAPDLGVADLNVEADLAGSDGPGIDLMQGDLTPVQISYPPAAAWISSGGGPATAASGKSINVGIGGVIAVGSSQATSGAACTFGYLSDDTY